MNEKLQIVFGLLGGLAIFLYGMNMMSECLQKAAGEKMKTILALLTKNPILGVLAGALTTAVLRRHPSGILGRRASAHRQRKRHHGHGHWFCQRRTYESATGNFDYIRCKYRYDNDSSDYRI